MATQLVYLKLIFFVHDRRKMKPVQFVAAVSQNWTFHGPGASGQAAANWLAGFGRGPTPPTLLGIRQNANTTGRRRLLVLDEFKMEKRISRMFYIMTFLFLTLGRKMIEKSVAILVYASVRQENYYSDMKKYEVPSSFKMTLTGYGHSVPFSDSQTEQNNHDLKRKLEGFSFPATGDSTAHLPQHLQNILPTCCTGTRQWSLPVSVYKKSWKHATSCSPAIEMGQQPAERKGFTAGKHLPELKSSEHPGKGRPMSVAPKAPSGLIQSQPPHATMGNIWSLLVSITKNCRNKYLLSASPLLPHYYLSLGAGKTFLSPPEAEKPFLRMAAKQERTEDFSLAPQTPFAFRVQSQLLFCSAQLDVEHRATLPQGAFHTHSSSGSGKQVFLLARDVPAWLNLLCASAGWYQRTLKPDAHLNQTPDTQSPYGDSPAKMEWPHWSLPTRSVCTALFLQPLPRHSPAGQHRRREGAAVLHLLCCCGFKEPIKDFDTSASFLKTGRQWSALLVIQAESLQITKTDLPYSTEEEEKEEEREEMQPFITCPLHHRCATGHRTVSRIPALFVTGTDDKREGNLADLSDISTHSPKLTQEESGAPKPSQPRLLISELTLEVQLLSCFGVARNVKIHFRNEVTAPESSAAEQDICPHRDDDHHGADKNLLYILLHKVACHRLLIRMKSQPYPLSDLSQI
ncbi:hypothetical protein IHE44_0012400 [Lamprotornis superbus]|uniref:Uncharacterized protein n=2 Tax=Amniota TaxID=32524 RepID=A0A835NRE6_9PASS|nr:hypothetical protein IHE44_0012400 [Lamprotornis superbus]